MSKNRRPSETNSFQFVSTNHRLPKVNETLNAATAANTKTNARINVPNAKTTPSIMVKLTNMKANEPKAKHTKIKNGTEATSVKTTRKIAIAG